MLRAACAVCAGGPARGRSTLLARLRPPPAHPKASTHAHTVLSAAAPAPEPAAAEPRPPPPPPPPGALPPPGPPRRAWTAAAALAFTVSLGGVYFYRKLSDETRRASEAPPAEPAKGSADAPRPGSAGAFPEHVEYLLVGGGTAAFAAMRALRAARPSARVLLVSDEHALPYMRPPLSKELWREPELAERALRPDELTFRQWNGRRRSVAYEPAAFYTPVERLAGGGGGAAVALGWRVARLDVRRREARLEAPGLPPATVRYERALVATGVRPRRVPALARAAAAGRSLALRSVRDAARLAAALDEPAVRRVAVVGGGFLATELTASLAARLSGSGKQVVLVVSEGEPLAGVLPGYLAEDAARRLREAGVEVRTGAEVGAAEVAGGRVHMRMVDGGALEAELVVECVGGAPDDALAAASGLETHPELGGVLVNAELHARGGVYAAGDAACFHDVLLGRRRLEHHDHAVVSGRLAGENMAAGDAARAYTHQSMFWSDLGPQLGYEAIGVIDSRLPTVGVFSEDAVQAPAEAGARAAGAGAGKTTDASATADGGEASRRYERGVVFYLRGQRVVGVLLWNLFNRMHVARQVLAQGEFEDLFEVAKLFAPHEED